MSGLYRSEDMQYVRLLMTDDAAYPTIRELGNFGKLHVVDLTATRGEGQSELHTFYKKRVAACQFWERKLLSFRELFGQFAVVSPGYGVTAVDHVYADVLEALNDFIEPQEEQITKNIVFKRQQATQVAELNERLTVLDYVQKHQLTTASRSEVASAAVSSAYGTFRGSAGRADDDEEKLMLAVNVTPAHHQSSDSSSYQSDDSFHTVITGILPTDKVPLFERMLFRVSRGNCVVRTVAVSKTLNDPVSNEPVYKSVFSVLLLGDQLRRRVEKLLPYVSATVYQVPPSPVRYASEVRELSDRLAELERVLVHTDADIRQLLNALAFSNEDKTHSPWMDWFVALQKEKLICDTLRKCDTEGPQSKMMRCEGWVPLSDVDGLRASLHAAVRSSQQKQAVLQLLRAESAHTSSPPTYFKTNKFTGSFQAIVDTYGVPRYKEVNPGLFTIITFPFLFGVMYGDVGHAVFITLFAVFMIFKERDLDAQLRRRELGEIFSMAYGGRYLLLMMGMFGIYAGTIYNDCMSVPFATFGTYWEYPANAVDGTSANKLDGHVPWGLDHEWFHTKNELAFANSFKMKLAVTLGVAQMTFGIVISLLNHLYSRDYLHVFFEFVPRLVFLWCTFGYMIFIVIYKFTVDWTGKESLAPNLVQTMIGMFLSPGSVDSDKVLYEGQAAVQAVLLLAALFSVPFMLFPIPCISRWRHKAYMARQVGGADLKSPLLADDIPSSNHPSSSPVGKEEAELEISVEHARRDGNGAQATASASHAPTSSDEEEGGHDAGHGPNPFSSHYSFSDHMITQGIHTIEFVLGTVSNTASYLRLWALSLAHAELADVFWSKMIMQYGVESSASYMMFPCVAIWAAATVAVLLCMDVLECFLHALRLHWVEFQNKFFNADGYAFTPFDFAVVGELDFSSK